jgi:hypothetical protein
LSAPSIRSMQVLMKLSCWSCIRTVLGNISHVHIIRHNFVASTMANLCCCCNFIYYLGVVSTHQHCNFLDLEFSYGRSWPAGMLINFQTLSPVQNGCAT